MIVTLQAGVGGAQPVGYGRVAWPSEGSAAIRSAAMHCFDGSAIDIMHTCLSLLADSMANRGTMHYVQTCRRCAVGLLGHATRRFCAPQEVWFTHRRGDADWLGERTSIGVIPIQSLGDS